MRRRATGPTARTVATSSANADPTPLLIIQRLPHDLSCMPCSQLLRVHLLQLHCCVRCPDLLHINLENQPLHIDDPRLVDNCNVMLLLEISNHLRQAAIHRRQFIAEAAAISRQLGGKRVVSKCPHKHVPRQALRLYQLLSLCCVGEGPLDNSAAPARQLVHVGLCQLARVGIPS